MSRCCEPPLPAVVSPPLYMGWLSSEKSTKSRAPPDAETAVAELRAEMARRGSPIDLPTDDVLRFAKARKLNAVKAADMLQADLEWRQARRVEERRDEPAEDILGKPIAALQQVLPHVCSPGVDKLGRPIIFKHFGGQCSFSRLCPDRESVDRLCEYNWWVNEQYCKRLAALGAEQWVVVIDAKGWQPGLIDRTALRVLKSMADTDADHYPERLGGLVVVNAPASLALVWRIVKTWLDEKTKAKVDIISSSDPKRATERLHGLAAPDQLPEQYAGTAPPLEAWPIWPAKSGLPSKPNGAR